MNLNDDVLQRIASDYQTFQPAPPAQLPSVLMASVDADTYRRRVRWVKESGATSGAAGNGVWLWEVPDDECWLVRRLTAYNGDNAVAATTIGKLLVPESASYGLTVLNNSNAVLSLVGLVGDGEIGKAADSATLLRPANLWIPSKWQLQITMYPSGGTFSAAKTLQIEGQVEIYPATKLAGQLERATVNIA